MNNNSKWSAVRPAGREHIPLYPKGFIAIRIVQLVLAVIVIGLAAYGVSLAAFDGDIFIMVVGLFTLIVSIYHLVAEFGSPKLYNYWAVLALDIFLVVMWIASFALLASQVASIFSYIDSYDDYYGYSTDKTGAACLAAASALGGVEFALFVTSVSIHGVMVHRHRSAGLHCNPEDATKESYVQQQPAPVYQPVVQPQNVYAVPVDQSGVPQQQVAYQQYQQ
ncbi:hypothetical protein VTK73DRAFT_8879 [Phialemonium thermophilum]|uniref:MARVEL domain-containing protein n=1 Tax=Phialemonium thermophilum TaxID=223376 RepID=A0ABR3W5P4_9PEZI